MFYMNGILIPPRKLNHFVGIEDVDVTYATGSSAPSELMVTSPTASRLPSLSSRHSAMRSRAAGLRRKLMSRLIVTASGTGPIEASTPTYMGEIRQRHHSRA